MEMLMRFKVIASFLLLVLIVPTQTLKAFNINLAHEAIVDTLPSNGVEYDTIITFNPRTYEESMEILTKKESALRKQQIENHNIIAAESSYTYHPETYEETFTHFYKEGENTYRIFEKEDSDRKLMNTIISFNPKTRNKKTYYRYENESPFTHERVVIDTVITYDYKTYEEKLQVVRNYQGEAHREKMKNHKIIEEASFTTLNPDTDELYMAYHFKRDEETFQIFKALDPDKEILETILSFNSKLRKQETWYRYTGDIQKVIRIRVDTVFTFNPETFEEKRQIIRVYEGETKEEREKRLKGKN